MTDKIELGAYAGSTESIEPLEVLCQLAQMVATNIQAEWAEPAEFASSTHEFHMLDRAATILKLNARHVPLIVDEVLEKAREHGGLR